MPSVLQLFHNLPCYTNMQAENMFPLNMQVGSVVCLGIRD